MHLLTQVLLLFFLLNIPALALAQEEAGEKEVPVGESTNSVKQNDQTSRPLPETETQGQTKVHEVKLVFFRKGIGLPIKRVEVNAGDQVLFSNPKGELDLKITSDSSGTVYCNKNGFEPFNIAVAELLKLSKIEVFMVPRLLDDDVIVVKGSRRTTVSRKTISAKESQKVAPGGDPAQVVQLLPGVVTGNFGSNFIIRGSGPNDSLYYIDDLEVPLVFHDIGNLSLVPTPMLSEVQFDSGGFSSRFGDATGGVLVLNTKTEIPKRAKTEFVLNIPVYSGLYHERPLSDDSFLAVSVRRSYLDFFINKVLENNPDVTPGLSIIPSFGDAHIFYHKNHEGGHSKLSFISSEDGLKAVVPSDYSSNENGTLQFSVMTRFFNLGLERRSKLANQWRYSSTPQVFYSKRATNVAVDKIEFMKTNIRMPTEFTKRLSKTEDLILGFDPTYTSNEQKINAGFFGNESGEPPDTDYATNVKTVSSQTENQSKLALWMSLDQQFASLKITPSLRVFYNAQIKAWGADPRLLAKMKLNDANSLKFAVGRYSKDPEPFEGSKNTGNDALAFESSYQGILGIDTKWSQAWDSEVQVFYKLIEDVIQSDVKERFSNKGLLRAYGAELFLRRNLTNHLFGWLSYTYSVAKERHPETQEFKLTPFDVTHVLNLVASYRISHSWEIGGRFNHRTGNVYTPVDRALYDLNSDLYSPRKEPDDIYSQRLPNLNSVSIYTSKDVLYDRWILKYRLGIESYWPKPQVVGVQNNYDFSDKEFQTGIAIPFVEVKGEF